MLSAAFVGFFTSLSLILAIGAQNAFILRQGIMRQHIFPLCLFCALSDALLIVMGVSGFDVLGSKIRNLTTIMVLAGAAFLFVYGALRLYAAIKAKEMLGEHQGNTRLWTTLAAGFSLTWLNPHVYLDTVVLIGGVSTRYSGIHEKWAYAIAAIAASFFFFFSLGYGSKFLSPFMSRPKNWQILNAVIAGIMWIIAIKLLRTLF